MSGLMCTQNVVMVSLRSLIRVACCLRSVNRCLCLYSPSYGGLHSKHTSLSPLTPCASYGTSIYHEGTRENCLSDLKHRANPYFRGTPNTLLLRYNLVWVCIAKYFNYKSEERPTNFLPAREPLEITHRPGIFGSRVDCSAVKPPAVHGQRPVVLSISPRSPVNCRANLGGTLELLRSASGQ